MKSATVKVSTESRIKKTNTGRPPRLYVKCTFLGFRKGKSTQNENQALVKLEGVNDRKDLPYYLGKRVVYVYKTRHGFRTIWGKVASAHGNNGVAKALFRKNLPPRAIGATLRCMLYPQKINA